MARKTVTCNRCGKPMQRTTTSAPEGKARCRPCRLADPAPNTLRTRQKRQEILTLICEVCGKSETYPWAPMRRKWCSTCRTKIRYYYAPRICPRCSAPFIPSCRLQVHCGRSCAHSKTYSKELVGPVPQFCLLPKQARPPKVRPWVMGWCKRCGKAFVIQDQVQTNYCSRRCTQADAKSRRRAVKVAAFVENVYRYRIFERDKWMCKLCGKRVKRKAKVPDPKAPTLDHILPLAQGGTHEPFNVQCAHYLCNSLKSDGLYFGKPEQMTLCG